MIKWFYFSWYSYLFSNLVFIWNEEYYFKHKIQSIITIILCRIKGHPNGPTWYNASGLEPDMSCIDCGDEL